MKNNNRVTSVWNFNYKCVLRWLEINVIINVSVRNNVNAKNVLEIMLMLMLKIGKM